MASNPADISNRLKDRRARRGWTQAQLAERAGVSRTAISAIEGERLAPSVVAALALARALECTVEDIFGELPLPRDPDWAWSAASLPSRCWFAEVAGSIRAYPAERTARGELPHDGIDRLTGKVASAGCDPRDTLVVAGCDPAASLLADEYERSGKFRLLPLERSSSKALELLSQGLVHVAGIHLCSAASDQGNAATVASRLGPGYRLVRLANWEEGIAFRPAAKTLNLKSLLQPKIRWVGREAGSGARLCLDELLGPARRFRHTAPDHRSVGMAIGAGWADAGVCPRIVGNESRLGFISFRWDAYDLCYPAAFEDDPRLQALLRTVRDLQFRRMLGELPGYDTRQMGDLAGT